MSEVLIEIQGLQLRGFHGALPDERRRGQVFLFDVELLAHDAGVRSDKLGDTVDYTQVVACIREVSDAEPYNLIEALAARIADALVERFPVASVKVRVRKPEVDLGEPVAWTGATVERSARRSRR